MISNWIYALPIIVTAIAFALIAVHLTEQFWSDEDEN